MKIALCIAGYLSLAFAAMIVTCLIDPSKDDDSVRGWRIMASLMWPVTIVLGAVWFVWDRLAGLADRICDNIRESRKEQDDG